MSAWKEWDLTGSEESYREFLDECNRDERRYRESMYDYCDPDEEYDEEDCEDEEE